MGCKGVRFRPNHWGFNDQLGGGGGTVGCDLPIGVVPRHGMDTGAERYPCTARAAVAPFRCLDFPGFYRHSLAQFTKDAPRFGTAKKRTLFLLW